MEKDSLGIIGLEAVVTYVPYLQRSRDFYVNQLDFAEIGHSDENLVRAGKQRTAVFRAGGCTVIAAAPEGVGGRAWRWLQRKPAGVGTIVWQVKDADHAFKILEARGATPIDSVQTFDYSSMAKTGASTPSPIDAVQTFEYSSGTLKMFSITTPFGGTSFRFVERSGKTPLFPGFVATGPDEHESKFGFEAFDHVTTNFETMTPALLWMEHVLGFKRYWDVAFHTSDVSEGAGEGSGLRSVVMWDPESGIKLANNEPWRPHFKNSQINTFAEHNRGDGIQHIAMSVHDILNTVEGLRAQKIPFLDTPDAYYDALPERIEASGIGEIDEDIEELRELGILVDGDDNGQYLLQIFMQEAAGYHNDPEAGPFFYEIIQRKGNNGFGEGNFRALFESIERSGPDAAEARA
jgi:4-hydroxyphenylpyruvate dioxygenase